MFFKSSAIYWKSSFLCYDFHIETNLFKILNLGGFYETYQKVFKTIEEEDKTFYDDDPSDFHYPVFGRSDSPDEVWQEFYSFFSAYVTTR